MTRVRRSPLSVFGALCGLLAVGFLVWLAEAGPAPLALLGLVAAGVVAEGAWFEARVGDDAVRVRSLLGEREFRWDELRASLRTGGWPREPVGSLSEADEVVIWTPDGRVCALSRSLVGYEPLVAELKRRGRLVVEAPPVVAGDRVRRALVVSVRTGWTWLSFGLLVGMTLGVGALCVSHGFRPTGHAELDVASIAIPLLAGWFVVSVVSDRLRDGELLANPANWAMTGAAVVFGGGLFVAAWFEDGWLGRFMVIVGISVAGYALGNRDSGPERP